MNNTRGLNLELPHPPSINHYYRISGSRLQISPVGKEYRRMVAVFVAAAGHPRIDGRLAMEIDWHPPDGREERDIDNPLKPLLDALQHAGVYPNDKMIDELRIHRLEPRFFEKLGIRKRGAVVIYLSKIGEEG